MKAIKGFNADMTCRGFQYVEGETYTQDTPAKLCASGFHAVTAPLDVFNYYPPASSVYHEVKLSDVDEKREGDSKVAGRKIKIGVALGIPGLVAAHVAFVMSNVKADAEAGAHTVTPRSAASSTGDRYRALSAASSTGDRSAASSTGYRSAASSTGDQSAASSTGDRSAASSTGDRSAASSTGDRSAASSTGYQSAASSTGDRSAASSTGDQSAASSTGDRSAASSTGDRSAASSTGDRSAASSTGDQSAASSTGDRSAASSTGYQSAASSTGDQSAASSTGYQSAASSTGEESIAAVFGYDSKARGAEGNWIVLTERDSNYRILEVRGLLVDGKTIKADTYYKLRGGKIVAA
jgi:hypothetical protein